MASYNFYRSAAGNACHIGDLQREFPDWEEEDDLPEGWSTLTATPYPLVEDPSEDGDVMDLDGTPVAWQGYGVGPLEQVDGEWRTTWVSVDGERTPGNQQPEGVPLPPSE